MIGSKEGQDYFATLMNEGRPGFFIDLGSGHPEQDSNSFRLEQAGWRGLSFEIKDWASAEHKRCRRTPIYHCDLRNMSAEEILRVFRENNVPPVIDFISFDVDEATLSAIEIFPFENYRFKCMTFEHDCRSGFSEKREKMRRRLEKWSEYLVLAEDIKYEDRGSYPFEDWWVSRDLCPPRFLKCIRRGLLWNHFLEILEREGTLCAV